MAIQEKIDKLSLPPTAENKPHNLITTWIFTEFGAQAPKFNAEMLIGPRREQLKHDKRARKGRVKVSIGSTKIKPADIDKEFSLWKHATNVANIMVRVCAKLQQRGKLEPILGDLQENQRKYKMFFVAAYAVGFNHDIGKLRNPQYRFNGNFEHFSPGYRATYTQKHSRDGAEGLFVKAKKFHGDAQDVAHRVGKGTDNHHTPEEIDIRKDPELAMLVVVLHVVDYYQSRIEKRKGGKPSCTAAEAMKYVSMNMHDSHLRQTHGEMIADVLEVLAEISGSPGTKGKLNNNSGSEKQPKQEQATEQSTTSTISSSSPPRALAATAS